MVLLNTYESEEEGELALNKVLGPKRLASERDGNEVIYNLFGNATWKNLYLLDLYNLKELETIIQARKKGTQFNHHRYCEIISLLRFASSTFDLTIPKHWL